MNASATGAQWRVHTPRLTFLRPLPPSAEWYDAEGHWNPTNAPPVVWPAIWGDAAGLVSGPTLRTWAHNQPSGRPEIPRDPPPPFPPALCYSGDKEGHRQVKDTSSPVAGVSQTSMSGARTPSGLSTPRPTTPLPRRSAVQCDCFAPQCTHVSTQDDRVWAEGCSHQPDMQRTVFAVEKQVCGCWSVLAVVDRRCFHFWTN